jgi:general transcription factor 3C polypeptide 3 (transcription factor C subunit 4)
MHLLNCVPHDLVVLDELRPILIEMSELALCASLFEAAFEHYQRVHPAGVPPAGSGAGFDALQLLVLADLDNALGVAPAAVYAVRAGTRWLQGRGAQKFWDACEDDREYDVAGVPLAREGELRPGMYPLDVNTRHRLAIARIKNGDFDEGKVGAHPVE